MDKLKNQRVLLFSPYFFGYEKAISSKIAEKFGECFFFDERANSSTLEKIFIRLNYKKLLKKKINNYYQAIINQFETDYFDYVLFINPESITFDLLQQLKNKQKRAKFILYMWDSFDNKPYSKELISLFDDCFTFNKEDSISYKMRFRPLFYIDDYNADLNNEKNEREFDVCFIGTIHSDRYKILKEVEKWAKNNNFKTFYYMFFPSWIVYLKYKIENLGKLSIKKKEFHFSSLSFEQTKSFPLKSNVIIDMQHPKQTGLTMRTVEMLGMKKKIITTNTDVQNYDFYNPNNIKIIDRTSIDISPDFIMSDYDNSNDVYREKYSIDAFINDIFDIKE